MVPEDKLGGTYSSSKLYPDHIYEDQLMPDEIKHAQNPIVILETFALKCKLSEWVKNLLTTKH